MLAEEGAQDHERGADDGEVGFDDTESGWGGDLVGGVRGVQEYRDVVDADGADDASPVRMVNTWWIWGVVVDL